MSVPRVIYGLAKKRAQLVAELKHPTGRHEFCRNGIATIDAALLLWPEGKDAPLLKRQHKIRPALIPNLSRKIVAALRDTGRPRTTAELADIISAGMELSREDRSRLKITVGQRLKDMRGYGQITATKRTDRRNFWSLSSEDYLTGSHSGGPGCCTHA